ncbi:DUF4397 domain-containing protein [Rhabdothermincola salaria]|uniref:DUF4397 domain-containing protein n=1 Tax=Rhabdothermincola salaria TaxID=2903142 RepID=UPI001E56B870|nr:hypothetical protein [Rhabdothermincola salaria]MCD9624029.1 hypothetical protein [Rhabdothermincola salaria]
MKRLALLAVMALVAVGLMPATAGAGTDGGTAQVTIVHDATYDAPTEPFTVTVCAGGEVIDGNFSWGETLGPLTLPAVTIPVAIYVGADQLCEGEPDIGGDLVLEPGDDITVAAVWLSGEGQPSIAVWPNDSSCFAEGEGRITARHGAAAGTVDVVGTIAGEQTVLIQDLEEGAQSILDVPGGLVVEDAAIVATGTTDVLIPLGDVTTIPGFNILVYAGGGADGGADAFTGLIELDPCEVPVETTTTTAGPTTTAAAQPATVTPRFTG